MSCRGSLRFGLIAAFVAVVGFAAMLPAILAWWDDAILWAAGGWLAVASLGVADGVWLNRKHGTSGSGFMLAMVVGILARLVIVGAGSVVAFRSGGDAAWGFLAGVGAGFVPVQAFEVIWFMRLTGTYSGQAR